MDEVDTVRKALTPAETRVTKGHLVDILEEKEQVLMKIRSLDGKTFYKKQIPAGSFFINCTDHLPDSVAEWDPILSHNGLVLSPQWLIGFSGPSAAYCTHMHYLGLLEDVWRDIPRVQLDLFDKASFGLTLAITAFVTAPAMLTLLPTKYLIALNPAPRVIPFHRILMVMLRTRLSLKSTIEHIRRALPLRFCDECKRDFEMPPVVGGNLGAKLAGEEELNGEVEQRVGARL